MRRQHFNVMSSSTRHKPLPFAASVALALALVGAPGVAAAAEPGVIVDPDSPTGKEYAIPLDKARSDTGGSSKPSRQTSDGVSQQAQPFGQGVEPASQDSQPSQASSAPRRTTKRPVRHRRSRVRPVRAPAPPAAAENASLASASAGSGTEWTLAIVFGVLVLGAGLGITLRRLSRRQAP